MTRLRTLALATVVAVATWSGPARPAPPDAPVDSPTGAADSLDALDEVTHGLPDDADLEDVTGSWSRERGGGGALDARVVDGWRRSVWLRASPFGHLALGGRWVPGASRGFVEWRSGGVVERAVVGGLRPSLAEGVAVGTRGASFTTPSMARAARGFAISPSRSIVGARTGAGAVLRLPGRLRLGLVRWDEPEGGRGQWAALEVTRASGALGVAVGTHRAGGEDAAVPVASVYATRPLDGGFVCAELARAAGTWLAAVRAGDGRGWVVEGFEGAATGGFGGGVLAASDLDERSRGGSVARRDRWRGVVSTVSVATRRQSGGGRTRTRRRLEWGARLQRPRARWSWRLRVDDEREANAPRDAVLTAPTRTRDRRLSARARVASGRSGRAGESIQVEVLRPLDPLATSGVVASVRLWGRWRFVEVEVAASDYALASHSLGYVVRPGIAGLETVTAVSGEGSDLAVRARCHVGPGTTIALYAGRPWGREARVLVSARVAWGR